MHARQPVPEALLRLADLQAAVVTREQALGTGFCKAGVDRMVRTGCWKRLSSGIYVTTSGKPGWETLAWAGVLIGGDNSRLGGLAAAHLHDLQDTAPELITVLVPAAGGVPRVNGPWEFRRERPGVRAARTVGSPPRLSVEDTVLDLACAPGADRTTAVNWITAAVQARLTTVDRLRKAMRTRRSLAQRRLVERILDDVAQGAHSFLEIDYLHNVERAHDLPLGRRQESRRRTAVDVWYEEWALLVELDGKVGHGGVGRFRDMKRDNAAVVDGFATLRYGHRDVYGTPCEVAWEVGSVLLSRGWSGPIARCGHCQNVP